MLILLAGSAPPARAEPAWKRALREQAAKQSFEPLFRDYAKETVAALGRLKGAREHLAFVKRHGIDLKVVRPDDENLPEGAIGSYVEKDRTMYISEDELMSGVRELRDAGAPEERIPGIMAWKFLTTVIHEIRHAITRRRMFERTGLRVRMNPLEAEYLSFLDEARVFREAASARPELWADPSRILEVERTSGRVLQELDRNVDSLKEMVRDLYEGKPSVLETPREKLLERYRRLRAGLEAKAEALLASDPQSIQDPEVKADLAEYAWTVAESLELYREILAVLADPAAFEKYRKFYADELEQASRGAGKPAR